MMLLLLLTGCERPHLYKLAQHAQALRQQLPGHLRLEAPVGSIQQDAEHGCWIALHQVQAFSSVFYTDDDGLLHHRTVELDPTLAWIRTQRAPQIWWWDRDLPIKHLGRFFTVHEIESSQAPRELYLRVEGEDCKRHEGHAITLHLAIPPEELQRLLGSKT